MVAANSTVLRPHRHLFRQGVLASMAFMVPVFIVLYFTTTPDGPWLAVLVTQAIVTLFLLVATAAYFRTRIWVSPEGIGERGFFGRETSFDIASVGKIVSAKTFASTGAEAIPQLFVCDRDGRQLVRLRGQFWSQADMDTVVATLAVPHEPMDETVSTGELRVEHPGLLYWFERHPVWAALAFCATTAVVGVVVLLALELLGVARF